jgi:replicative DNA helicase
MAENQFQKQSTLKNGQQGSVIALQQGILPPQSIDMEEAVLGALMIDNSALSEVIDILHKDAFYKEEHKLIFEAITKLFSDSEPIDMLTVAAKLREMAKLDHVGGEYYLAHLSQKVASSAHIEYHSRIILQKHIQRELIGISSRIIEKAYDETTDVLDLLDEAEGELFQVAQGNLKRNYETAETLIKQAIERIEEIAGKEGLSGVPSGFTAVDRVTSGWQPSDLVIIAARPGMGKTAFVLSMARNMAIDHEKSVAVFSLEMSSVQLITRLISSETGLTSEKLRKGNLNQQEWSDLTSKVKDLEKAKLFIDDTPALSIFDLRAKCRRLASKGNIDVIIIDYLQLMTVGNDKKSTGNREQEISTISRSLKSLSKELNVPVIALSQLSRAVETRSHSKRPQLSDLRESGAIEQDADIVSFIYRPEYYGMTEYENGDPSDNSAELIIAKHRNGSLEDIRLRFEASLARFSDITDLDNLATFESKMNYGSDDENGGYDFPENRNDAPF